MIVAWRVLGITIAAMTVFIGGFAIAGWVTHGSVWMLAFFPPVFAAAGSVVILGMRWILQDDD